LLLEVYIFPGIPCWVDVHHGYHPSLRQVWSSYKGGCVS